MKQNKRTAGFTLVELIVVIAIMGILAGVGTVGYSGYIKSANKNADKVLVGNIMRAIETGVNSTMFTPPEPLSVGTTTYPVGFVALSTDGCSVLSSGSSEIEVTGECEFVTEPVTYVTKRNTTITCTSNSAHTTVQPVYSQQQKTVTYCKTHSANLPAVLSTASTNQYPTGYKYEGNLLHFMGGHNDPVATGYLQIPAGTLFVEDINDLYTASSDGLCIKAANPGLNVSADPVTDGILYDAIHAAFGSEDLKLKYSGWVSDEGADYATFYTYAPDVFENVKDQTALLISAVNSDAINGLAQVAGITLSNYLTEGTYASSAELLDSFSAFVSTNMSPTEWSNAWAAAANQSDEYTFGIDTKGGKNDYIWAARMAYNSSFASYCSACGVIDTYTDLLVDYGEDELGGALHIPSVVNNNAFSKTGEGSLLQSFLNADAQNGQAMFDKCKALYATYISSTVADENGDVFYETANTLSQTGDVAMASGDYFGYYNNYLTEMANLYTAAQTASSDGIMIIVTMADSVVNCSVSPSAANPRNS